MTSTAKASPAMGKTQRIAGMAVFTAIVIVLQLLGSFIRFGPFSISLVLVPIVIGAALYGSGAGAWLGFVFGAVVILSGDAAAFLAISVPGTVVTCLAKGALAGLGAGCIYRLIEKKNATVATAAAAVVCPVINTSVFLIGCRLFFIETVAAWGAAAGFENVGTYMIVGFVGVNFLVEMAVNVVLSPVIVRLIRTAKNMRS